MAEKLARQWLSDGESYVKAQRAAEGRWPLSRWAEPLTAVGGVILAASAMLLGFYGQHYVESNVLCLVTGMNAIRQTQPLDADRIAREVGPSRYPFWPPAD